MEALYDFNHQPSKWDIYEATTSRYQDGHSIHQWGGPMHRRAAKAIYTIAFLCMLRVDEALKIQMYHIEIGAKTSTLTLPFSKTHQFGGELLIFYPLLSVTNFYHWRNQAFHSPHPSRGGSLSLPHSRLCRLDICLSYHLRLCLLEDGCWWPPCCQQLANGTPTLCIFKTVNNSYNVLDIRTTARNLPQ